MEFLLWAVPEAEMRGCRLTHHPPPKGGQGWSKVEGRKELQAFSPFVLGGTGHTLSWVEKVSAGRPRAPQPGRNQCEALAPPRRQGGDCKGGGAALESRRQFRLQSQAGDSWASLGISDQGPNPQAAGALMGASPLR